LVLSQNYRTIKGKVLSEKDKAPLPGVSVYVDSKMIGLQTSQKGIIQNRAVGTVTNEKGEFKLSLPQEVKKLDFSYLGFETKTITLSKKTYYTVYLSEDIQSLQEVVVTGYQKIEKRKLTGSVNELKTEDIQQAGVSNIGDLMQGQAAGVLVVSQTGAPGEIPRIRIRGTSSLSPIRDPLWVVDGVPLEGNDVPDLTYDLDYDKLNDRLRNYPVAGLNPYDIENITILKDAAATAIYGARAANGVIVITTKKGKKGKMRVNFYTNTSFIQRPDFDKLNLMNASEKVDFELAMAKKSNFTYHSEQGAVARILKASGELELYQQKGFSALSPDTQQRINQLRANTVDWGKLLYQSAYNINTGASISGGTENSDYYFSLGYYDEKGTSIGTGFKRYNLTLKNHYTLFDKIKIGVNLQVNQNNRESYLSYQYFTSPSYYLRHVNPYLRPQNKDGKYNYDPDIQGPQDIYVPFNVLEERSNTSNNLKDLSLNGIFDLNIPITKHLNAFTQMGLQTNRSEGEKFAAEDSYYARRLKEKSRKYESKSKTYQYFLPEGGIIENSNKNFVQWNWKTQLELNRTIGKKHEIEALAGSELRRTKSKYTGAQGFGYDPKLLTVKPIVFPSESYAKDYKLYQKYESEHAFASFYSTASYTYNRKYSIFGSIRYEGSDLFGADPKYKYLPIWAVSGAWRASEEPFLKAINAISNLKFRLSYGYQGNIDRNTSPFVIGRYGTDAVLPGKTEQVISVTSPPNDKLRWEKTENINAGVDLGIFKDRIRITFDAYTRKGSDLIGVQETPLETGFGFIRQNGSQITNKGFELSLITESIKTKNFRWTIEFNLAHNKSKVERQIPNENSLLPSLEGYPVNALFTLRSAGIDEHGYPLFYNKEGQKVSVVKFLALYDPYAKFWPGHAVQSKLSVKEIRSLFTYAGDAAPKYTGGITHRFFIKNFDLTIASNFSLNRTVRRSPPYPFTRVDRGSNYSKDILQAYPAGDLPGIQGKPSDVGDTSLEYMWYHNGLDFGSYEYLDLWIRKMSHLRISSIRMGYTLPKAVAKKLSINQLRLSIEGRNLMVFGSNYKGYFDPETYGNPYAQPLAKSITLGLNVTF